jgi:putative ABC transport system permease protein
MVTRRLSMTNPRHPSRAMFWRIIRRLLTANRGRLFVILLALGAGAAVTAALLNVKIDANRRLTTEFRSLGANVVVAPRNPSGEADHTLDQSVFQQIPSALDRQDVGVLAILYVTADAFAPASKKSTPIVVAGQKGDLGAEITGVGFGKGIDFVGGSFSNNQPSCWLGATAAGHLHVKAPDLLTLRSDSREETCRVDLVRSVGGPEDDQVTVPLDLAQRLAALPDKISLIQISVAGTPRLINDYIADLAYRLPDADVHGIRQFTEAEAKIYDRISGLLTATVAVVLILTTLCVMAAMTNVAMERKNDVGLMKAIGGATRRVLRLFLAEAAVLGLIGGVLGAAVGILLSIALGRAVFGVAAQPRLIVYPISVTLTILVAVAGASPLRRLASIRPASVFRGEA